MTKTRRTLEGFTRANEVADALRGTAGSLADHATPEEMDDKEFLEELDLRVFECEVCGWWCGSDEESATPMTCDECCNNEEGD